VKARAIFACIFVVCAGLLGVAFYMEHVMGLEPCPLCWLQRFGFMGVGLVSLVAALHGPKQLGVRIYGLLLVATAGAGLGTAGAAVVAAEFTGGPGARVRPFGGIYARRFAFV